MLQVLHPVVKVRVEGDKRPSAELPEAKVVLNKRSVYLQVA